MLKPKMLRSLLNHCINDLCKNPQDFLVNPSKDFSRDRKLPLNNVIQCLFSMENKSLFHEINNFFHFNPNSPSTSAFVQQRAKIKPEAFEHLFKSFIGSTKLNFKTYRGYRLFAVDGTDLSIPPNPNDPDSFFQVNNAKPYGMLHLNAMYDLINQVYTDIVIQKRKNGNEHKALVNMVDRSDSLISKAIVLADRGYESYNNMAHIHEKGFNFLIRVKSSNFGSIIAKLALPEGDFDKTFTFRFTRKITNENKELAKSNPMFKIIPNDMTFDYLPKKSSKFDGVMPYELKIRFVKFQIRENEYEVIATDLDEEYFSPDELKKLYAMRWGIENSFRDLKYTVGLVNLHSKKMEFICQEIFVRLLVYNFSELIASQVVVRKKKRKYCYKVNFSGAVQICRDFFLKKISEKNIEMMIEKYLTPIRPNRHHERNLRSHGAVSFVYRMA